MTVNQDHPEVPDEQARVAVLERTAAAQAEQLRAITEQLDALSSALAAAGRHAGMSFPPPARHLQAVPR